MTPDGLVALKALEMECGKKSLSENQHGYAQMAYHHLQKRLNDIIDAEEERAKADTEWKESLVRIQYLTNTLMAKGSIIDSIRRETNAALGTTP